MGKVWVRARQVLSVHDASGRLRQMQAGDCFGIGKYDALMLISQGAVEALKTLRVELAHDIIDCGVVVTKGDVKKAAKTIHSRYKAMPVIGGKPHLEYPRTLIWRPSVPLRLELMYIGFHRLQRGWQLAVPLVSYDRAMAHNVGTAADRKRTRAVVSDLRIPLYETGLMYVRRCPQTIQLFERWAEERKDGGDERLAFLRALFEVNPVICALPVTWTVAGVTA